MAIEASNRLCVGGVNSSTDGFDDAGKNWQTNQTTAKRLLVVRICQLETCVN